VRVIPGAAEHTVVLEQTPVDDLRDPVQGPERWNRADLEPLEVTADLVLGPRRSDLPASNSWRALPRSSLSEAGITAIR
jgi:hypothetical protein